MNELYFTRGTRDYLRAADLLRVAPLSADLLRFEMRFLKSGNHAGEWVHSSSDEIPGDAVARLVVLRPHHPETWVFVPYAVATKLQLIEDLDEAEIVAPGEMRDGRYHSTLTDRAAFWDQLIAQIRFVGEQVLPGRRWYVASVAVTHWPLPQEIDSHRLSLGIQRQRRLFLKLELELDDQPFGRILLREIAGGTERARTETRHVRQRHGVRQIFASRAWSAATAIARLPRIQGNLETCR